jgi:hypothetical protein
MASRKQPQPITVVKPKGFDHTPSDLVDVVVNAKGEFVQIFNRPHGNGDGARVILSYQRTPTAIESIHWTAILNGEPLARVEILGEQRIFTRSDGTTRVERMLPSGNILVSDSRLGLSIKSVWSAEFNWDKPGPKGRPLTDRGTFKLQDANLPWYICFYQVATHTDSETSEKLVAVEEYCGTQYLRTREFHER